MIRTPRKRLRNYQHYLQCIEGLCQAQYRVLRRIGARGTSGRPVFARHLRRSRPHLPSIHPRPTETCLGFRGTRSTPPLSCHAMSTCRIWHPRRSAPRSLPGGNLAYGLDRPRSSSSRPRARECCPASTHPPVLRSMKCRRGALPEKTTKESAQNPACE